MDAKTVGKYKIDIVQNGVDFQDQHFLNTYYGLNINVFWKLDQNLSSVALSTQQRHKLRNA